MSKSFFLNNQEHLNLEDGGVSATFTQDAEIVGNNDVARTTAAFLSGKTDGISKFLQYNLENANIDLALRRSAMAIDGMFQRSDAVKYNAESYANQGNEPYRGMTIDFNFGAATQDEFGEGFYRTMVIDPAEGSIKMSIDIPLVYDLYEHDFTAAKDMTQLYRSAIHAYVDDSILSQSVTELIPNAANADYSAHFVATSLVPDSIVKTSDGDQTTRPLKTGVSLPLIGIATPTGAANKFDATDTIAGLEVTSVTYKAGSIASGLRLALSNSAAAGFIPAQAGVETTYQLQNLPIRFVLNKDTKLADGTLLNAQTGWDFLGSTVRSVTFEHRLGGSSNFQTGKTSVGSTENQVTLVNVISEDGDKLGESDATYAEVKTILEGLVLSGWTPKAVATNLNRRKQGRLIDIVTPTRNIPIIFGQPMSIIAPTLTGPYGTEHFRSIENLTKVQRIVNSNNAVKAILNDFNGLVGLHDAELDFEDSSLPGLAQFYIRPWAELAEIDLVALTQSQNSADIRRNIEAVILNTLLSQTTRAYKESRLVAAARYFAPVDWAPKVQIGTDPQLEHFVNLQGDARILGDKFKYDIASTPNTRMNGLIVWTFTKETVENPAALDPLESGIFAWVPELVGTAQITRTGSTNLEAIVVPRTRHFKNTPIIGMIRVKGLDEALTKALPFKIDGKLTLLDENGDAVTPAPAPTPTPPTGP